MQYQTFYENLLQTLRQTLPQRSEALKELAAHLRIDQKSLARRMRGETPFTVEEITKIFEYLNLSFDSLLLGIDHTTHPMKGYLRDLLSPMMSESFRNVLRGMEHTALDRENGQVFFCSNFIPNGLYAAYAAVTKFFYFSWLYRRYPGKLKSIEDFQISEDMSTAITRYGQQTRQVKSSTYLFSMDIMENISGYILSIHEQDPFPTGYSDPFIEEMTSLLNEIEQCTIYGVWPGTENSIQINTTPLILPNGILLTEGSLYKGAVIYSFFLNPILTIHPETFLEIKALTHSLLRNAEIITVSGERKRKVFLRKQREALSRLSDALKRT